MAGLRRGEIDQLLWRNVDLDGGRIIVDSSEHGRLKTPESHGALDIVQHTVEILREFRAKASGKFVIEGGDAGADPSYFGHDIGARRSSSARHGGLEGMESKWRSRCTS